MNSIPSFLQYMQKKGSPKNETNKIAKSKQESMVQYIATSVNDTRIYENTNTEIQ
jgi:hypothetical protein